ncbi:MAG: GAF domain-containing protein [Phycisphaerales bacterium]|nr:MAG: hypothetical protein IPK69_09500 [Phycisphaerales bacterium]
MRAHSEYPALIDVARAARPVSRGDAMRLVVDLLWRAFGGESRWSWVGFYERAPGGEAEMVLVCREPKPACSPIGLHGMCGKGLLTKHALVIDDVRTLGENYVACDPRDLSELVVPVIGADGACDAVLDADSFEVGAFTREDAAGCWALMHAAGLVAGERPEIERVY